MRTKKLNIAAIYVASASWASDHPQSRSSCAWGVRDPIRVLRQSSDVVQEKLLGRGDRRDVQFALAQSVSGVLELFS